LDAGVRLVFGSLGGIVPELGWKLILRSTHIILINNRGGRSKRIDNNRSVGKFVIFGEEFLDCFECGHSWNYSADIFNKFKGLYKCIFTY
jgi:hypothetical protein